MSTNVLLRIRCKKGFEPVVGAAGDYTLAFDIEIIKDISYQGRGCPGANAIGDIQYQVTAKLATSLQKKETKEDETGCFILVSLAFMNSLLASM
ncbi:hypothetical protein ELY21_03710 [Legionella sp. km535]|uniref:hypothetical protein n=1 Tax=Legionella sp. km535 TaxID=2498107 RepID=UPI000F8F19C9|nr:hypothetical protein [Legionella sp. km535]RUR19717.1 hypothetical protein ELY21_03710 [Legionella sp. km535]